MEDIGSLFQQSLQEASLTAACAKQQQHAFDKALELRINLQKVLDSAHRLPVEEAHEAYAQEAQVQEGFEQLQQSLASLLDELTGALKAQVARDRRSADERKADSESEGDGGEEDGDEEEEDEENEEDEEEEEVGSKRKLRSSDTYWENISKLRQQMQPKWEATVNSWHARVHFGSETTKNKLKMFNQTIWEQIDGALQNQDRVIEKSRMQRSETKVFGAALGEAAADPDSHDAKYDLEVYDDRAFYQMLLKSFIAMNSASLASSELSKLRSSKRRKDVDRKASKGRKLRFTPHPKLENFMFPRENHRQVQIDVDRLFASLFQ